MTLAEGTHLPVSINQSPCLVMPTAWATSNRLRLRRARRSLAGLISIAMVALMVGDNYIGQAGCQYLFAAHDKFRK